MLSKNQKSGPSKSSGRMTRDPQEIKRYIVEGKEQFEKLRKQLAKQKNPNPIMIPPIPNSKFIDRFPDNVQLSRVNLADRSRQQNYELEVIMYRAIEKLAQRDTIVLHGLDYTHAQYSSFVGDHLKIGKTDVCSNNPKDADGECDFIIILKNTIVIIEVKNLVKIESRTDINEAKKKELRTKAFNQGVRTRALIENIFEHVNVDKCTRILHFSAFPNFVYQKQFVIDQQQLANAIFKDDLTDFESWWNENVDHHVGKASGRNTELEKVTQALLTLWCTDQNNECHWEKFDLGKSIMDVDSILEEAKITFRRKNYGNPAIVEAPKVFRDYLGIENLTSAQKDIFDSTSRVQFINGPAGSGKTALILGKIIEIMQTESEFAILLARRSTSDDQILFDRLQDICEELKVDRFQECNNLNKIYSDLEDISEATDRFQFFKTQLYVYNKALFREGPLQPYYNGDNYFDMADDASVFSKLIQNYHIFIDDFFMETNFMQIFETELADTDAGNYFWTACDLIQSNAVQHYLTESLMVGHAIRIGEKLPTGLSTLTANLRNSKDIAEVLSLIRSMSIEKIPCDEEFTDKLFPKQEGGHFVHGPKVVIHWFKDPTDDSAVHNIVQEEVEKLCKSGAVRPQDIIVLYEFEFESYHVEGTSTVRHPADELRQLFLSTVKKDLVCNYAGIYSSERQAVIVIYEWGEVTDRDSFFYMLTGLYVMISRARVYCSVIFYTRDSYPIYTEFETLLNKLSEVAHVITR